MIIIIITITLLILQHVSHFTDADGCKGGVIQWAFDYVTVNDGINTAQVYPYVGKASVLTRCTWHA